MVLLETKKKAFLQGLNMKQFKKKILDYVCACARACVCVGGAKIAFKMLYEICNIVNCTYMAAMEPDMLRKMFFRTACGYTYELQDIIPVHFQTRYITANFCNNIVLVSTEQRGSDKNKHVKMCRALLQFCLCEWSFIDPLPCNISLSSMLPVTIVLNDK